MATTTAERTKEVLVEVEDRDYTELLRLAELLDDANLSYDIDENKIMFLANNGFYYTIEAYEANIFVEMFEDDVLIGRFDTNEVVRYLSIDRTNGITLTEESLKANNADRAFWIITEDWA